MEMGSSGYEDPLNTRDWKDQKLVVDGLEQDCEHSHGKN